MNIVQAEENLKKITTKFSKESFIFDLMWAYDFPKATISRLQKGTLDKAKNENEVVLKKKFYFISTSKKDLDSIFEKAIKDNSILKHDPRFIIVTDNQSLKAYDTKAGEKLDTEIKTLSKHPDFFLPWAGIEKKVFQGENPADVKAAEKLAKFFDLILHDNLKLVEKNRHALNVFLTRILFCFFAEDTDIFEKGLFTKSINDHTNKDGNDLADYLQRLFEVLNKKSRTGLPDYLKEFPYVNGGLFAEEFPIPKFSKRSRESLIDLGSDLNWAEINPDIFGSMIQAVVHPDQRAGLGMHYTSVTNIMKVIEPLFLNELHEEFRKANNENKLNKLLKRIREIKIFDPACGSGNFLIISYKELRKLELKILKLQRAMTVTGIPLSNFYGIEIDDFAHEVAKLSLWLAEHQMNSLFNQEFKIDSSYLPLRETGKIVCGNAVRLDWNKVCPKGEGEIYLIGNPPYLGGKTQSDLHKEDMDIAFEGFDDYGQLDYISCWFIKSAQYINSKSSFAFVTTSSLCQGAQVEQLWTKILALGMEISFAYKPFYWSNSAKNKAAVTCSIIGIKYRDKNDKKLFDEGSVRSVKNINPYLVAASDIIIEKQLNPISDLPPIITGNSPYDGGHLIFSENEMNAITQADKKLSKYFKKLWGSSEFINGTPRYCLWIDDSDLTEALKCSEIKKRIALVKDFREKGGDVAKSLTERPHQFRYRNVPKHSQIIIPRVSSERREYIPTGFLDANSIVSDSAQVILDPEPYVLGVISSKMHMEWVKISAGRLKMDFRYSSAHCYNTFPFPSISEKQKEELSKLVMKMISVREKYPEKSLLYLYDPDKMPNDLFEAHQQINLAIDRCYRLKEFSNSEERLEYLFELYREQVRRK